MLGQFFIEKIRNKNRKNNKDGNSSPFIIPIEVIQKQCLVMKKISEENKKLKSKLNFITTTIEKNMLKKKTRQMKNGRVVVRKFRSTNYSKNIEENRQERRFQLGINQKMLKTYRNRQYTRYQSESIHRHSLNEDGLGSIKIMMKKLNRNLKGDDEF